MKHIFKVFSLALLVGAMFTLSSCKKDNQDLIIGKWSLTSATTDDDLMSELFPLLIDHLTYEFTDDGILTVTASTGDSAIDEFLCGSTNYSIEGNNLIVKAEDEEGRTDINTITIDEITKNSLTLTEVIETIDGVPTSTATQKFKKI